MRRSEAIRELIKIVTDSDYSLEAHEAIQFALAQFDYVDIAREAIALNVGFSKALVKDDNGAWTEIVEIN